MIHRFPWNTLVRLAALVLLTSTMPATAQSIGDACPQSLSKASMAGPNLQMPTGAKFSFST
jgi:hypothetical protein